MGGCYWLPLYYQAVMSATSLRSGLYLLPLVLSLGTTVVAAGIIIKRTGNYRIPIITTFFLLTLGFGLFTGLGHPTSWAKVIIFQIIAGCGIGPNFQALLVSLQANVEPSEIGSATCTIAFLRQIGSAVSIVVGGVIFNNEMQNQHEGLAKLIGPSLEGVYGSENACAAAHQVRDLPTADRVVVEHAYWKALQKTFIAYACCSFTGFCVSFLVEQKTLKEIHAEHKTGLASLKRRCEIKALPADHEI